MIFRIVIHLVIQVNYSPSHSDSHLPSHQIEMRSSLICPQKASELVISLFLARNTIKSRIMLTFEIINLKQRRLSFETDTYNEIMQIYFKAITPTSINKNNEKLKGIWLCIYFIELQIKMKQQSPLPANLYYY